MITLGASEQQSSLEAQLQATLDMIPALGADWDSHIPPLHPDDQEETRRVSSTHLRTGNAGEVAFRVRDGEGGYRFLSRAEPLRGDGPLLYWIG